MRRSTEKKRCMTGKEQLATLGIPVYQSMAAAAHVELWTAVLVCTCLHHLPLHHVVFKLEQDKMEIDLPQRMLCKCAGNGMHLGSVGFSMLMAVLCLAPA